TGTMPTKAIVAGAETYEEGYHAGNPSGLSAIDTDLAPDNIKETVNIFGKEGTVVPAGVETLERYYSQSLAAGATYTPADSGIFFVAAGGISPRLTPYYNGYRPMDTSNYYGFTAIGDGSNLGIKSESYPVELLMMRHYITTWTYDKYYDDDLPQNSAYVPADGGFFACGTEWTSSPL
ncbi:unnamed protein product, partial [marine sediment metagenome]